MTLPVLSARRLRPAPARREPAGAGSRSRNESVRRWYESPRLPPLANWLSRQIAHTIKKREKGGGKTRGQSSPRVGR